MVGPGCSSCYKESFQYSSLPLDMLVHTHGHTHARSTRANVGACAYECIHAEACTWVCAPRVHRDMPHGPADMCSFSHVHRHAHTHLVQSRQNTQRPAPQAHPRVHSGPTGWVRVTQLCKHPRAPVCTHTLSGHSRHLLAVLMMPAWSSPHGALNRPRPHSGTHVVAAGL